MSPSTTAVAFRATIQLGGKRATGIQVPDAVVVALRIDALAGDGEADRYFADLSDSNQRRYVLSIEGAKTGETRRRRIAKIVATLRADGP